MKAGTYYPRHVLSRVCGGLLVVLLGVLSAPGADPAVSIPIPESRYEYTGLERQRIRYLNSSLLRQAHERIAREDYPGAKQALMEVIVNDPGNNRARVMLIHVHNRLDEFGQARELVEDLLSHYPDYLDLYLERAFVEMRVGEWAAALDDLERFAAAAPADHPRMEMARQNMAEALFRVRRFEEAAALMRELTAVDTVASRIFLAECAMQQGRWDEAIPDLQAALRLDPTPEQQASAMDRIGYAHYELEQYEDALSAFEEALTVAVDERLRAELYLKLGYTLFYLEAYDRADAAFAQAQTYFPEPPERPEILYQRGVTAYRDARYADAVDFYAQRLEYGFDEDVAVARLDALPEGRFLYEYAVLLYGLGRYEEAVPLFDQAVELLEEPDFLRVSFKALADIHLLWNRPDDAIQWLDRAASYGESDRGWQLARARADYQQARYDHTIDRLLPLAEDDDLFNLYIGFSFYNRSPSMPGLSLAYMNRIQHPEKLTVEEQFNFYANRAYLNYDQYIEAQALADVERALAIRHDRALELVRLRALVRYGAHLEVLERGEVLVAERDQDPAFLAPVYEMMGLAAYPLERWTDAIHYFTEAVTLNPELLEARYQRGLAYLRQDEEKEAEEDLLVLEPYARIFPPTFWGDLGFVLGHLREYEAGTEWLTRSLELYPYDIDGWQERGYQSMKDHRNPDAKESFEEAIVLYDEIIPYVEEEDEAEDYREMRMSLKQEYTKLDKVWSLQVYGQRTDFDFDESQLPAGAPGDSTQGALQSQGGVSVGFRPPKIGFRNERTLDLFLRVLANFEPRSWSPDEDSYQGGLGLMYKPFIRHNYVFGFERLFKIGDNAEDNWLWRNTYGIEAGERPKRGQDFWIYRRFYGEASYYFETPSRWVFFGQGNIGPSFRLSENLLLTVPEALLVGRYQDDDPEGIGTYWYYGPGLNIRLLEGERALTRDRWALTGYAHYVWGRFDQSPENIDKNDFEGWIIGVNFTR